MTYRVTKIPQFGGPGVISYGHTNKENNMAHLPLDDRFIPQPRTTVDGKQVWCVYDRERKGYSTYTCHGNYKSKRECQMAIVFWNVQKGERWFR